MKPWTIFGAAISITAASIVPAQAEVTGAGSTFAQLILSGWAQAYQQSQADAEFQPIGTGLDYEPIGSQGGILRASEAAVDFGATDVPLHSEELAQLGLAQFPFVIGGIATVVNIQEIEAGELRLTGEILADIYLGKIQTWADPAIMALNPDLPLPHAPIAVIHRSDGSGTTFNFASFLTEHSAKWQQEIGRDLVLRWPTGTGVKGNEGVAQTVRQTANAIGYVDFAQAQRSGLSYTLIRNRSGSFVRPSVESFQAAAASVDWSQAKDFDLLLTDTAGPDAYPIVAATFALMPIKNAGSARSQETLAFFRWSLENGAPTAAELGYVPIPPALITQIATYWMERLEDRR